MKGQKEGCSPRKIIFLVVPLTLAIGAVLLVFNRYNDAIQNKLFSRSLKNEDDKDGKGKGEKDRIEYHAMVADKIYAENIEEHLK